MNIKELLHKISYYYDRTRRVGHTVAMIRGASRTHNVIVLASDRHHQETLRKEIPWVKVVTASDPDLLVGEESPLLLDNFTIWQICKSSLDMIENMERLTESLSRQLDKKHDDLKKVTEQRDKLAAGLDVAQQVGIQLGEQRNKLAEAVLKHTADLKASANILESILPDSFAKTAEEMRKAANELESLAENQPPTNADEDELRQTPTL